MKPHHFNLWRWIPVIVSAGLMVLIIVISAATISGLRRATQWRERTFQVVLDAQTFEDKLLDAQRSEHAYARDGRPELLVEYQNDTHAEMRELNELMVLTNDDAAQQARLQELTQALQSVFSNDNKVISIYARQGSKPALAMDESPETQNTADIAINDLEAFTDAEKQKLIQADAAEQKNYHRAAKVLIAASLLATALLVLANYIAGRELDRRRMAERLQRELVEKLQAALSEVKALSGLIPICAWCKNVRNDKGYWSTVEQYVQAHTDVSFSHGICPECREKLHAETSFADQDNPSYD